MQHAGVETVWRYVLKRAYKKENALLRPSKEVANDADISKERQLTLLWN